MCFVSQFECRPFQVCWGYCTQPENLYPDKACSFPVFLHGPLAAIELKERFNIKNPQVLETIKWHTTGHPEFSLESWAMFIADKVEPNKIAKNSDLQIVSDIAGESLEKAALTYIDIRINEALQLGLQIHPMSIHTRNTLLSKFDAISNSGG